MAWSMSQSLAYDNVLFGNPQCPGAVQLSLTRQPGLRRRGDRDSTSSRGEMSESRRGLALPITSAGGSCERRVDADLNFLSDVASIGCEVLP